MSRGKSRSTRVSDWPSSVRTRRPSRLCSSRRLRSSTDRKANSPSSNTKSASCRWVSYATTDSAYFTQLPLLSGRGQFEFQRRVGQQLATARNHCCRPFRQSSRDRSARESLVSRPGHALVMGVQVCQRCSETDRRGFQSITDEYRSI